MHLNDTQKHYEPGVFDPAKDAFETSTRDSGNEIVTTELLHLRHGEKISPFVAEALFGGELNEVWDKLLDKPGKSLVINGSAGKKAVVGGFVINPKTKLADPELRSDNDILIEDQETYEAAIKAFPNFKQSRYAVRGQIGHLDIDFVSVTKLRNAAIAELDELAAITAEANSVKGTNIPGELTRQKTLIADGDFAGFLAHDRLFSIESLGVRLTRMEDGTIEATVEDPNDALGDYYVKSSAKKAQGEKAFIGVAYEQINTDSNPALLIITLANMDETDFRFETELPTKTIVKILNIGRNACENDIELIAPLYDGKRPVPPFVFMHDFLKKIAYDKVHIQTTNAAGEIVDAKEYLALKSQEYFARNCGTHPSLAFEYAFTTFPLAKFIIGECKEEKEFFEYADRVPPNNKFMARAKSIKSEVLTSDTFDTVTPAVKITKRFHDLATEYYDNKKRYIKTLAVTQDDKEKVIAYPQAEKFPANMSEVMAMAFVAFEWDFDKNQADIDRVIAMWKPKGTLEKTWGIEKHTFDMGLDKDTIKAKMEEFSKFDFSKR